MKVKYEPVEPMLLHVSVRSYAGHCPVLRSLWNRRVVKGLGDKPLMLLTTEAMRRNRALLWRIVQAYLMRWRKDRSRKISELSSFKELRGKTKSLV